MDPHVSQESGSLPGFVFFSSLEGVKLTSGCDVVCDVSSDKWSVFECCSASFWLNSVVLESSSFVCSGSFDFSVSSKTGKCISKTNEQKDSHEKHIIKALWNLPCCSLPRFQNEARSICRHLPGIPPERCCLVQSQYRSASSHLLVMLRLKRKQTLVQDIQSFKRQLFTLCDLRLVFPVVLYRCISSLYVASIASCFSFKLRCSLLSNAWAFFACSCAISTAIQVTCTLLHFCYHVLSCKSSVYISYRAYTVLQRRVHEKKYSLLLF